MKIGIFLGHPKFYNLLFSIGDSLIKNGVNIEYITESSLAPRIFRDENFSKRETDYCEFASQIEFYNKNFFHVYGLSKNTLSSLIKRKLMQMPNLKEYSTIIFWNWLNSLEYEISKILWVKVVCIENWYIPNSFQVWLWWVNALSHIRWKSLDELKDILDNLWNYSKKLEYKFTNLVTINPYVKYLCGVERLFLFGYQGFYKLISFHLKEIYFTFRLKKLLKSRIKIEEDQYENMKKSKNIFLVFQVHDDTQIFINSDLQSSLDIIKVYENMKALFPWYNLFAKIHPKDIWRFNYEKTLNEKGIPYFYTGKIEKYIEISDFIFLINSSVWYQSLLQWKKVISFWRTLYNMIPWNFEFYDSRVRDIRLFISENINNAALMQYIDTISKLSFVGWTWENFTKDSIASICKQILYYDQKN